MKLIWHIVRKDFVRDRSLIVLWSLLFVGQIVVGHLALNSGAIDAESVTRLQQVNGGLVGLQIILGYFLVVRLVHADALIGTKVFWLTRPISAVRLLAAKLLGALLIFGLLPVVLLLPWWLYCNFGWRDIFWTAVETLSWQWLMIVPAFLLAALTDDLSRALLWTLVLVAGLMTWVAVVPAVFGQMVGRNWGLSGGALFTRAWFSAVLFIAGAGFVVVHQYLTRRFALSMVLVVVCLGLAAVFGLVWPGNWARSMAEWNRPTLAAAPNEIMNRLTVEVGPATGSFRLGSSVKRELNLKEAHLNVQLRTKGLPADISIAAERIEQSWLWSDGLKLTRSGFGEPSAWLDPVEYLRLKYSFPARAEDPETILWRKMMREKGEAKWIASGLTFRQHRSPATVEDGIVMNEYVTLPNSLLAKISKSPPAYAASVHCILYRPEVLAELELKTGTRAYGDAQSFRIINLVVGNVALAGTNDFARLDRSSKVEGCLVTSVTMTPSVTKSGLWFSAAIASEFSSWLFRSQYVAVNHATREVGGDVVAGVNGPYSVLIGGVVVTWDTLSIRPSTVIRNGQAEISDPRWLEHTTLVVMEDKEVARFTREVKTDKFELVAPPKAATD